MKKIFSLLTILFFALWAFAETEFTFTSAADLSQTKDGITISLAQGSNTSNGPTFQNPFYLEEYHPEMRLYAKNTITVSGSNLTNIQLVFAKSNASGKEYAGLSASTGTLSSGGTSADATDRKVDSWKGSATIVVFTLGDKGQRQIQRILIDGAPIEITPEEELLPSEADLKSTYVYAEPTIVGVKDTTVLKKEYAFIDNNILVHCTQGSILKENKTEGSEYPAYFNVNENQALIFTATQAIQKIEIDGYLRKAFTASCDKGTMVTKASEDFEVELDNAIVITGIKSTSVTLNCDKQLRCFEVRVYFKEGETGLEEVQRNHVPYTKVIENGVLYLVYKGTKYNVQGKVIEN
ncbi:MAG: hypothetical protein J5884_06960 [Paludibacteraceae bacterium]|nr:hypothetical protein [Paludibacteraceae bacterium]